MAERLDRALRQSLETAGSRLAIDGGANDARTYDQLKADVAIIQQQITGLDTPSNVGILANQSCETYAAVIAVLLSGRTFIPLNPKFPIDRLRVICEQAGCDAILFDPVNSEIAAQLDVPGHLISKAENQEIPALQVADISDSDIAYRMFTSGSTGLPKGVPIRFESLDHYVREVSNLLNLESGLRFSQTFDLSFDLSMHDIFIALTNKGTIVPPRGMDLMMPHNYIIKKELDVWFSVPMLAGPILQAKLPDGPPPLVAAMFCGEPLPLAYARGLAQYVVPDGPVLNLYGPTEATIAITERNLRLYDGDSELMPIGRPFGQNQVAILIDEQIKPAIDGVEGELLLGGVQVFDGYEPSTGNNPFVSADDGQILYRSGDLVRVTHGEMHHLGRIDSQVKIRGYRIELGEIEQAFRDIYDRHITAAVSLGTGQSAHIGIAYCGEKIDYQPEALAGKLPDYMIPRKAMQIDALPTNVNGKIDRQSLETLSWA